MYKDLQVQRPVEGKHRALHPRQGGPWIVGDEVSHPRRDDLCHLGLDGGRQAIALQAGHLGLGLDHRTQFPVQLLRVETLADESEIAGLLAGSAG